MDRLIFFALGLLVGIFFVLLQKIKTIGTLQIVRMEHEEPYIFLELHEGQNIETISQNRVVALRVNDPKKPRN